MKNQKWDKAGTFWVFSMLNILVTFQNMDNESYGYIDIGVPGSGEGFQGR